MSFELCSLWGCDAKRHAKTYCKNHYMKWRKYGDPLHVVCETVYGEPLKWLKDQVNYKGNDCLKWPYGVDRHGRGIVHIEREHKQAHRIMCQMINGNPPTAKHEAAHNCGKGHEGCVNPIHLRWATKLENHADRKEHGTLNEGEKNPGSTITKEIAAEILNLKDCMLTIEIAKLFNTSPSTVSSIHTGKHWTSKNVK